MTLMGDITNLELYYNIIGKLKFSKSSHYNY